MKFINGATRICVLKIKFHSTSSDILRFQFIAIIEENIVRSRQNFTPPKFEINNFFLLFENITYSVALVQKQIEL